MRNGGGQKECQKKRGWPLMEGNSNERNLCCAWERRVNKK